MTLSALATLLEGYIKEPDLLNIALESPDTDLFTLGLDSMGAFALLDDLAECGVDVDYSELVAEPTVAFLMRQGQSEVSEMS